MELHPLAQRETHLRGADFFPGRCQHGLYVKGLAVVVNQAFIHIRMDAILERVVLGMDIPGRDFPLTCPFEGLGMQGWCCKQCSSSSHRQKTVFEFHGTLLNKSFTMQ
ncbi:hypothetical protein D3C72_1929640 [compost metagenome]